MKSTFSFFVFYSLLIFLIQSDCECLEKYYIVMCRIKYDIENLVDKILKFFESQPNEENYIIK